MHLHPRGFVCVHAFESVLSLGDYLASPCSFLGNISEVPPSSQSSKTAQGIQLASCLREHQNSRLSSLQAGALIKQIVSFSSNIHWSPLIVNLQQLFLPLCCLHQMPPFPASSLTALPVLTRSVNLDTTLFLQQDQEGLL